MTEKFSADFLMGGAVVVLSKCTAAPIERVKLLLQNQGEMMKRGQLKMPYIGVGDCFQRVLSQVLFFLFCSTFFCFWPHTVSI